ncbi:MAG: hypothetical protein R3D45_13760 [Rhizobiaceae bacterium]
MRTYAAIEKLTHSLFVESMATDVLKSIERDMKVFAEKEGVSIQDQIGQFLIGGHFYKKVGVGLFSGLPHLIWNGLFADEKTPRFVHFSSQKRKFRFTTPTKRVITPQLMDTDGGSIPMILHGWSKMSPWRYGPGYIIHDWIFVAHKCKHKPDDDFTFEQSALILAEAIKTQMEVGFTDFDGKTRKVKRDKDVVYLIYKAVSSRKAKKLWDRKDTVVCR